MVGNRVFSQCLKHRGFTFVELLVLIAITCILAAFLLPSLQMTLHTARVTSCANQQKLLYTGMITYADVNGGWLARNDYGRFMTGSWAGYGHSIVNDRPAGDPAAIVRHGAWLIGGGVTTDSYFCPAITFEDPAGTLGATREAWQTEEARLFFSSGGTLGSAKRDPITVTSYVLNGTLRGNASVSGNPMQEMIACRRASRLRSYYPILSDARQVYGTDSCNPRLSHHGGHGFNVLAGGGSVRFLRIPALLSSSQWIASALIRTRFNPWAGVSVLPNNPSNIIDQTAWADWSGALGRNPFSLGESSDFWQSAMAALKYDSK